MRCPFCAHEDSQVKDSRPTEDGAAIRRRRQCPACAGRFTTFERAQLRELTVVKKTGKREPFEREKLVRSIQLACRKRPIESERIEQLASGIIRRLESSGDGDVPTIRIGQLIMDGLRALDAVAYIRFASVYKDFRDAADFSEIVTRVDEQPAGLGPLPKLFDE